MIKIAVSEIKEFFKRSKSIRPNNGIPILSNVKLEAGETCRLLKTNLNSYCVHEINASFESPATVLIDEKVLLKVLEQGTSDEVEIRVDGGKVHLKCGIAQTAHTIEDETKFPAFPVADGDKKATVLHKEVLEAIGIASQTLVQDRDCQISYVHVNGAVFSSDNFSLYLKKLSDSMPDLVLDKECCQVISEYESLQHFEAGNYNFFDTGKTMYGFVKTTHKTPNYQQIFKEVNTKPFEINREDFISFCELTTISPAKVPVAAMKSNEASKVVFDFNDTEFGKGAIMEFEIDGKVEDVFLFNPRVVLPCEDCHSVNHLGLSPLEKLLLDTVRGNNKGVTEYVKLLNSVVRNTMNCGWTAYDKEDNLKPLI